MYRSSISRVNEQSIENPSFVNQTSHAYVGDNGAVLDAGASGHVLTGINEVDFRAGDKILAFSDQTTSGQEVGNHGIRMEVTSSPVTDANTLGDGNGIVVKILSISSSVIASHTGSAIPTDVLEIDILYKETGKPTVYTVKTLKPSDGHPIWPDLTSSTAPRGEFNITTDMIHAVVASNQLLRPWDNVPRKAVI